MNVLIGFSGPLGEGKSVAADYLVDKLGFRRFNDIDGFYESGHAYPAFQLHDPQASCHVVITEICDEVSAQRIRDLGGSVVHVSQLKVRRRGEQTDYICNFKSGDYPLAHRGSFDTLRKKVASLYTHLVSRVPAARRALAV